MISSHLELLGALFARLSLVRISLSSQDYAVSCQYSQAGLITSYPRIHKMLRSKFQYRAAGLGSFRRLERAFRSRVNVVLSTIQPQSEEPMM